MFTHRHRIAAFHDVVFITSSYGLGETVVQGAVNPDEFYVHKPTLKAASSAIIRRNLGSKLIRMEFASAEERAASGKLVKTRRRCRPSSATAISLSDADVAASSRATRSSSSSTTAARWTSSGARTASTASSTSCRRAPRR